MSKRDQDLKRLKLTRLGKAWVKARAHATGKTEQEIASDAIHKIALQDHRAARVFLALAPTEDHGGDGEGQSS